MLMGIDILRVCLCLIATQLHVYMYVHVYTRGLVPIPQTLALS